MSKEEKKTFKKWKLFLATIIAGIVIGAGIAAVFIYIRTKDSKPSGVMKSDVESDLADKDTNDKGRKNSDKKNPDKEKTEATATNAEVTSADVSAIVENIMPSVVSVKCAAVKSSRSYDPWSYDPWEDFFYDYGYGTSSSDLSGTGFIIGQNGNELLIVTNNSVVSNADKISIVFNSELEVEGTIKGADSYYDIAVVSVDMNALNEETLGSIKIATIGSSENLSVGDMTIAIGNSLGNGQSVTVGYVSALDRTMTVNSREMKLLQTDAAINDGNNGGPLVNIRGEVIGIASEKYTTYSGSKVEGMCFAIPISDVIPVINELMNRVPLDPEESGYLGIEGKEVSDSYAKSFGMPKGIYVYSTEPGSPAEQAGIRVGDIITQVNGRSVVNMDQLKEILSYIRYGTEIEIKIATVGLSANGYEEKTIKVTLGQKSNIEQRRR